MHGYHKEQSVRTDCGATGGITSFYSHKFVRPLKSISMKTLIIPLPPIRPPPKRPKHLIQERQRSPMQTRPNIIHALLRISLIIPSRLHDIDLSTRRPDPIRILHRQHPNRRPNPVTCWHFRNDFDFAVSDVGGTGCVLGDDPR